MTRKEEWALLALVHALTVPPPPRLRRESDQALFRRCSPLQRLRLHVVAEYMGHADGLMTLYYYHPSPKALAVVNHG